MGIFNDLKKEFIRTDRSRSLNAFSHCFDAEECMNLLEEIISNNSEYKKDNDFNNSEVAKAINLIQVAEYMHAMWESVYKSFLTIIESFDASGTEIMSFLVAFNNRNDCVVRKKFLENLKSKDGGTFLATDMTNFKIESSCSKDSYSDISAALEGATESLNILFNYLRYFVEKTFYPKVKLDNKFVAKIIEMMNLAEIYTGIKRMFDSVLYEDGFVTYTTCEKKSIFKFDYFDHNKLMLIKAGKIMMQQLMTHETLMDINIPDEWMHLLSGKGINTCTSINGNIKIECSDSNNEDLLVCMKGFIGSIKAYYAFIQDVMLPKLNNIHITEVFVVWCTLQYIARETLNMIDSDCNAYKKEDLYQIPQKILKEDLIEVIDQLTTNISKDRIEEVLKLFISSSSKRTYIWTTPLYDIGDYFLFPLFPINFAQVSNLIDFILKKGGIDLKLRGKWMEKYVISHIEKHPNIYEINFWGSRKFKGDNSFEEIDLLGSLQSLIIVCELKCIHYSMEPNEYHDAWNRLADGCKQAKRKTDFVKLHPEIFAELGDYSTKRIIPVVITNYPIFTGFSYDGVYVVDMHSFLVYIEGGGITLRSFGNDGNNLLAMAPLYDNEEQFSLNFESFLAHNPVKEMICRNMEIKTFKQDKMFVGINIEQIIADYNNDPQFNISNSKQ